jgi:hypothetical protein
MAFSVINCRYTFANYRKSINPTKIGDIAKMPEARLLQMLLQRQLSKCLIKVPLEKTAYFS